MKWVSCKPPSTGEGLKSEKGKLKIEDNDGRVRRFGGRVMDTFNETEGGAFQTLPYFCWGSSRAWRRTWRVACLLQCPRVWAGWPLTQSICLKSQESATQMFTQVTWLRGRGGSSWASCATPRWCPHKHTPTHSKGNYTHVFVMWAAFIKGDSRVCMCVCVYNYIHCFTVPTRTQNDICSPLAFRCVGRSRTCVSQIMCHVIICVHWPFKKCNKTFPPL